MDMIPADTMVVTIFARWGLKSREEKTLCGQWKKKILSNP